MQKDDRNSCSELKHSLIFLPAHSLKGIAYLEEKQFVLYLSPGETSVGFNLYNSI